MELGKYSFWWPSKCMLIRLKNMWRVCIGYEQYGSILCNIMPYTTLHAIGLVVYNTCRWCTMQLSTVAVVHNIASTNPNCVVYCPINKAALRIRRKIRFPVVRLELIRCSQWRLFPCKAACIKSHCPIYSAYNYLQSNRLLFTVTFMLLAIAHYWGACHRNVLLVPKINHLHFV